MVGPLRYWEDFEVGQEFDCGSRRLSLHEIVGFAVDFDPQDFHIDPIRARDTAFGSVIASGLHTISVAMALLARNFLNPATSMGSPGLDELRWLKPVRPDDTLSLSVKVVESRPSRSRPEMGTMLLAWTMRNQHGEAVMTVRAINMIRRRPDTARRAVKGIDHAVVVVQDLDEAERRYRRLGFAVQPRGRHARLGTANHLMIFERNYFELIGVVEANEFNASRRDWLQRTGGGLANLALATDGADLAYAALAAAGLDPEPPLDFGRPVEIADRTVEARFKTVRIAKAHAPVVGLFVCDHLTPDYVYRAEWARHANGVRGLAGVTVISGDPQHHAELCRRHFSEATVQPIEGGLRVTAGAEPIDYVSEAAFGQRFPGLANPGGGERAALLGFTTESIAELAGLLQSNGVAFVRTADGRILVAADDACGVALAFEQRT